MANYGIIDLKFCPLYLKPELNVPGRVKLPKLNNREK